MEAQDKVRADIQILRGVAVLAVMLAHFGALLPGGFLGVDIFFAISGFVITLSFVSLYRKTNSTTALLSTFWKRRFWRLFPALALVLFVTLASAFFLLPAEDFRDQWEMTVWSFFFAGNIGAEVLSQQEYFDPAAQYNWLLHLWSLGVEEQFYLIFPFLMLLLLTRRARTGSVLTPLLWVSVAGLISLALASANEIEIALRGYSDIFQMTGWSAVFGYYSPLTRAWQFVLGMLVALLTLWWPLDRRHRLAPFLGMTVLVGSLIAMPESNLLPGPLTLFPMVAMFLLLRYPMPSRLQDSAWLSPLKWLGNRSYSAYLWHWPVWSVLTTITASLWASVFGSFVVTFFLAAATYRFVERPLNKRYRSQEGESVPRVRSDRKRGAVLALFLFSPLALGGTVSTAEDVLRDAGLIGQRTAVPRIDPALDCIQTDCAGVDVDVLLIGDSHAGALSEALSAALGERGISMRGAVVARHFGCLHLPSIEIASEHPECRGLSTQVRNIIAATSPKWVVIYGYTAGRFTTINSGGDQEISLVNTTTNSPITEGTAVNAYRRALEETTDYALDHATSVIIVSGTPDFSLRPEDVGRGGQPATLAEVLWSPLNGTKAGQTVTRGDFINRHGPFIEIDEEISSLKSQVTVVDSWAALCRPEFCSQVGLDGELLYADQDHLSERGAARLAEAVSSEIPG